MSEWLSSSDFPKQSIQRPADPPLQSRKPSSYAVQRPGGGVKQLSPLGLLCLVHTVKGIFRDEYDLLCDPHMGNRARPKSFIKRQPTNFALVAVQEFGRPNPVDPVLCYQDCSLRFGLTRPTISCQSVLLKCHFDLPCAILVNTDRCPVFMHTLSLIYSDLEADVEERTWVDLTREVDTRRQQGMTIRQIEEDLKSLPGAA